MSINTGFWIRNFSLCLYVSVYNTLALFSIPQLSPTYLNQLSNPLDPPFPKNLRSLFFKNLLLLVDYNPGGRDLTCHPGIEPIGSKVAGEEGFDLGSGRLA